VGHPHERLQSILLLLRGLHGEGDAGEPVDQLLALLGGFFGLLQLLVSFEQFVRGQLQRAFQQGTVVLSLIICFVHRCNEPLPLWRNGLD
jgi:hypothetical protein